MSRTAKPPIAVFSALADATRCRILALLLPGPVPVHKLAGAFSISRPAISRHLRVLKEAGLVAEVKKGRENLYALRSSPIGKAQNWLDQAFIPPAKAAPEEAAKPAKPAVKPAAPVQPAPKVNQMGFDF